ncbi:RNA polymerase sigma factor [Winogradskyella sp. A3E31]|uniref:RNA polymerase sigma factor n=1 Tax=Winogradskyella sp. A3E31 TaxID=3349637 RepID=UPI00398AA145
MSLDQLIIKCKKGDAKAQEQLYRLYARKLFSVCIKYSNNYSEAEDHLQDAFVTIFNKIEQFSHKGSFEGWMKRIAVNTVLQKYRGARVFEIINEEAIEDVVVDVDDEDISLDFLLDIIQALPERYRMVFNLYVLDGFTHKEISNMLKISIGTSKSNLARARMILKTKIEEYKAKLNSQSL